MRREDVLTNRFPRLADTRFRITSPPTSAYNCIAWAAGDDTRLWLPDPFPEGLFAWPDEAPREHSLGGWARAFEALGYEVCADAGLEEAFEKVAVYGIEGLPKHVARQLPSGRWTSKLGGMEDIEHELEALEGERYGAALIYLRRPKQ